MTNPTSLTNRELDAFLAENVMGWKLDRGSEIGHEDWWMDKQGNSQQPIRWSPTEDRNAAALVLEKIGEMGLQGQLILLILPSTYSMYYPATLWPILTATPRELMEAVKKCWESQAQPTARTEKKD